MRYRLAILLMMTFTFLMASCGDDAYNTKLAETLATRPASTLTPTGGNVLKTYSSPPSMTIDQEKTYLVTLNTDHGDMVLEMFASEVPNTVNNFVFLARDGYYDNVIFHRVIKGFMIQGGDPDGTGRGGPGYTFADESFTRDYLRGTVAMANAGPNTNGSQFFIIHEATALPKNYTVFGQVNEGLDVLDAIATAEVTLSGQGELSKPVNAVYIKSATVIES
jgi:cyclophilin family peptidyl-prolyl cis-trans isomerase